MATNSKAGSSKSQSQEPEIQLYTHSMHPDSFGSAGFQGGIATMTNTHLRPWCSPNSETGKHMLFAFSTLITEDGEQYEVKWQFGWFGEQKPSKIGQNWYPSKDGRSVAGPDNLSIEEITEEYATLAAGGTGVKIKEGDEHLYEGPIPVNFSRNPPPFPRKEWAQFVVSVTQIPELQDPKDPKVCTFPFSDDGSVACFDGHKFMFDRADKLYKSKNEKGDFKVIIPTQYFGLDEEALANANDGDGAENEEVKPKRGVGKPKVEESEEEEETTADNDTDDNDEDALALAVENSVVAILRKQSGPVPKRTVTALLIEEYADDVKTQKAVEKLWNSAWAIDEERKYKVKSGLFSMPVKK